MRRSKGIWGAVALAALLAASGAAMAVGPLDPQDIMDQQMVLQLATQNMALSNQILGEPAPPPVMQAGQQLLFDSQQIQTLAIQILAEG